MAYYDKKVVYLSYNSYGSKVKSAGFVKAECSGRDYSLDMRINGMQEWTEKQYDILAVTVSGKEYAVGRIFLHNGAGEWKAGCLKPKEGGKELAYEEIEKLRIDIADGKTVEGIFRIAAANQTDMPEERGSKNEQEKAAVPKHEERALPELKAGSKSDSANSSPEPIRMDNIILNDKWQQLLQVYPVIHPYEDEREYVSIEPKDFVIMSGDYQHLANNSFLLHGFYNYRHIILGKEKETGNPEGSFYLGVPGVYYEREKMVALMFGFEAFECNGGKAEPGKFGYYLRKVKI